MKEIFGADVEETISQMIFEEIQERDVLYTTAEDVLEAIEEDLYQIAKIKEHGLDEELKKAIDKYLLSCVLKEINTELNNAIDEANNGMTLRQIRNSEYF